MARTHEHNLRAAAERLGGAHRRADPEPARNVVRRRDDTAARAGRRRRRAAACGAPAPRAPRRPRRTRRDRDARVSARPGQGYGSPVIDTPPGPPRLRRPRSSGRRRTRCPTAWWRVGRRPAPGGSSCGSTGRSSAGCALSRREFRFEVDLPPRDARVRDRDRRRRRTPCGEHRGERLRPAALRHGRASGCRGSIPRLQTDVRRLATGFPGAAAVYVENLGTGATAAWNAQATFPAASTLKLAIAVTALSRVDGPPRPGTSLDGLLRQMLDASDNEAANRLLVSLGGSTSGGGRLVDDRRCARSGSSGR